MSEHPHGESHGDGWLDQPANVDKLVRAFYVICLLALLSELFIHKHVVYHLEGWFGFYPVYGFIGIVLLVLLAKLLRKGVMRSEEYYDA